MLRLLLTLGIGLPALGGLFAWYGYKERDIAAGSTQTPETISLKDLIARGPDGNANIVLTDYVPCDNFVIEKKHGVWEGAWVPVVPKEEAVNGEGGSPTAFKAVIFTS